MTSLAPSILVAMTPEQKAKAGREVTRFNHRLAETGLFTDEALATLLDEFPRDQVTICTMRENPPADERWIAGEAWDLSGAELVEAATKGALWVSPRSAMTKAPAYKVVFEKLMKEFSAETGIPHLTADAAILLSAPRMGIFFHVDPAETMLWHIRGHKTIHVFPPKEEYVTEAALEAILMKETLSDLPYEPRMEDDADLVALSPGEAAYWPMHAPHRVINGDDLNVSISIEFSSPRSMLTNGVFYTHAMLRRRLGLDLRSRTVPDALKPAYWAAALALKKLAPPKTNVERSHLRQFDIDMKAPGYIRWREGYGPQAQKAA
jgi:hypothetical protein